MQKTVLNMRTRDRHGEPTQLTTVFRFVQYGRLHGAGYQQAVILWSLVLDDRRTIRAHDSSDIRKRVRHNRIRTLCRRRDMR